MRAASSHFLQTRRIQLLLFSLFTLGATTAYGFAEDICPRQDGGWARCNLSPCQPSGGHACSAISFITTLATAGTPGSRSTLHFDATYYMAQAIGFSPRDAYDIAAYNDATDLTQLVLYGRDGRPLADINACSATAAPAAECTLVTRPLTGVSRANFESGGMFFHFTAMPDGSSRDNGMNPALNDAGAEPLLAHLRRWALGQGPLCVAGITNPSAAGDYATGDSCFQSTARPDSTLVARLPIISQLGPITSFDWTAKLGEQAVLTDPATGASVPASQISQYLPADIVPLVRLAIYLHVVSDRVSHHRCADASIGQGPRPADAHPILMNPIPYSILTNLASGTITADSPVTDLGKADFVANPDFLWQYATLECGQPEHAERHTFETGTKQSTLNPEDRTARPTLATTYDAMLEFARYYHLPGAHQRNVKQRDEVVSAVIAVEEEPNPGNRLDALTRMAREHHWLPLPGYGLSFYQWNAQAGTHYFSGTPAP